MDTNGNRSQPPSETGEPTPGRRWTRGERFWIAGIVVLVVFWAWRLVTPLLR